jgi:hypothetical protein
LDPHALQDKIDAYRIEWNTYERLIRKVSASHPAGRNTRSAA